MPFHVSLIFNRLGQLRKVPELNDSSKGMELQDVCRELGIRATGKKAELIARIRLQSRALPRQGGAAQTSQTNRNLLRNLKTSPDQAGGVWGLKKASPEVAAVRDRHVACRFSAPAR